MNTYTQLRTQAYYDKLESLLEMKCIDSIVMRGCDDLHTVKILSQHQLRCAQNKGISNPTKRELRQAFHINIAWDEKGEANQWNGEFSPGIGYGALWIEQSRSGSTIAELVAMKYTLYRLATADDGESLVYTEDGKVKAMAGIPIVYLSHIDEGELNLYEKSSGDGWFTYDRLYQFKPSAKERTACFG